MALALDNDHWTCQKAFAIAYPRQPLTLSDEARARVLAAREQLERLMADSPTPLYGINTGFGALCQTTIAQHALTELQHNLVRSHACGAGPRVPRPIISLIQVLKAKGLVYGHSAVRPEVIDRLLDHYNRGLIPVLYEQGSLGASGDLAPLAHLTLPLMGEGHVYDDKGVEALYVQDLPSGSAPEPLTLAAKEGLALLNGTQFMAAYGVYLATMGEAYFTLADQIAALSLEVFSASHRPFHPAIHRARPHQGQQAVAARIEGYRQGSGMAPQEGVYVQDPYSFRCIPQVHGASYDALSYLRRTVETEINAVTDNPLLIADEDLIVSGGNFHGQPLALALDFAAMAMAEMASISERRTYQLISGVRGLPAFLAHDPGLHSGMMIPQYTAASIVSANKQLCHPASVDTIPSSNGQEDHVSMGANAATKAWRVLENLRTVLAIELMTASRALEVRRPAHTTPLLEALVDDYCQVDPYIPQDHTFYPVIERTAGFIHKRAEALALGQE